MRGLIFALFLLAGLLVCGCVGAPPAEETAEEAGEEVTEGEVGAPAEEEEVEAPEEAAPPEPSGPVDYTGMEYAGMMATGNPIQCDVTYRYQGEQTTAKVYMRGENRVREEITVDGESTTIIIRDDTIYVKMQGGEIEGCEWLAFETDEEEYEATSYEGEYTTGRVDFEEMPEVTFECYPWTYDESKFAAPPNACTMEDIMGGYVIPDYQ